MKDDRLYLIHIRDSIARIKQYTKEGKDVFLNSILIQDAVTETFRRLPSLANGCLWTSGIDIQTLTGAEYKDFEMFWFISIWESTLFVFGASWSETCLTFGRC